MPDNLQTRPHPSIAIILPVVNEAEQLPLLLTDLCKRFYFDEIVFIDGGSVDGTSELIQDWIQRLNKNECAACARLIHSVRGRALQMNAGASAAASDILLFLHADTRLPDRAVTVIRKAIARGYVWGRFDIQLDNPRFIYRVIESMMNWRSALTGIATGDQTIFVRRDVFTMLGGYPRIALMEDIALCKRLNWIGKPALLKNPAVTSTRRWRRYGVIRTVLLMWLLRLLYWMGVSPGRLALWYR